MRVMAIGATGFIGRHVVAGLVRGGHEVAVLHRGNTPLAALNGVTGVVGDRSMMKEIGSRLRAWAPDVVVDMILSSAAQARMTLEVFHGAARRVVAVSSGDVYRAMAVVHRLDTGPLQPVPLTEDSALRTQTRPYSPEALAVVRSTFPWVDADYDKVRVEQVIGSDPELPATILRLPMVYGPGDPLHRLYPVVKRIQDQRPAIVYEQAFAQSVPCRGYVENVAHAITVAITSFGAAGRVYNVADPEPISEADWAAKIGATVGWAGRVVAVPRERAPKHLVYPYRLEQHLFMDSTRIRAELGYVEPFSIEEALRRTILWERANPPAQVDPAHYDYAAEDSAP